MRNAQECLMEPAADDFLIHVPLCHQERCWTCGPAVVQCVLAYHGTVRRQDILVKRLRTTQAGTRPERIMSLIRRAGLRPREVRGMSLEELNSHSSAGRLVIVGLQAWPHVLLDLKTIWTESHYAVVIGFNTRLKVVYFMDPHVFGSYTYLPDDQFMAHWHFKGWGERMEQFGIVVEREQPPTRGERFVLMR